MTQMVAAKLGIALLPRQICAELNRSLIVAVPLAAPQLYLQLAIIWRKDRYLSAAARRWLDFARHSTRSGL
jgi:DNA-binding transcriptional LysR family regulator